MKQAMIHFPVWLSVLIGASTQSSAPILGLPMVEVHTCSIQFTNAAALQGRWGGQIAIYDAATDGQGSVVRLTRRVVPGREHLPPLVRLDQFEACVKGWRFGAQTVYEVSLLGGTTADGEWIIQVRKDNHQFRLRMPVSKFAG
jgi:hypothetical protein